MSDWSQVVLMLAVLGPVGAFVLTSPTLVLARSSVLWRSVEGVDKRRAWAERYCAGLVATGFILSLAAALTAVALFAVDRRPLEVNLGEWFSVGHYAFEVRLVFDRLSIPFVVLNPLLCGLIGAFSRRYMHQEPGFFRFFNLLALFGAAMQVLVLAGSIDVLFMGWELVGLTSALLIAYFSERPGPIQNGIRAFATYRFADMGILAAALWLHHSVGHGEIVVAGTSPFGTFAPPQDGSVALLVGFLLLVGSMGKGALVPLSGWLPRAMEGPTSSSAIFYGALSIHAGPFLLLRGAAILESAPLARACVVALGAITALHATLVGRVQTDIKSSLAYASLTQVGIIVVEIGLGFYYLALVHMISNACLRTLQLVRAPSLLHDRHQMENAVGAHLPRTGLHLERMTPGRWQRWLYVASLERHFIDAAFLERIVFPFLSFLRRIDRLEQAYVRRFAANRQPDEEQR